jgi:hypothetical protein
MRVKLRLTSPSIVGLFLLWSAVCTALSVALCSYEYDFVLAKYLVLPMFFGSLVTLPLFICAVLIFRKIRKSHTA